MFDDPPRAVLVLGPGAEEIKRAGGAGSVASSHKTIPSEWTVLSFVTPCLTFQPGWCTHTNTEE